MTTSRRCVFCGSAAGSLEHAWPEWLQRLMNPNRELHVAQMANGKIIEVCSWNLATHRHVCERCNSWMGDVYEGPASALIRTLSTEHATFTISKDEQRLLALWVYKTTLMLECTRAGGIGVERGECVRFCNTGSPPSDCSILMGFCDHNALAYHRSLISDDSQRRIGYATTMVVGRLIFHILGDADPQPARPDLHAAHQRAPSRATLPEHRKAGRVAARRPLR